MSRSLKKNKNISPHRKRLENIKDKSIFEEKEEKEENILLSLIERVDELESDMEKKNIEIENLYSELTNLRYQIEKIEK